MIELLAFIGGCILGTYIGMSYWAGVRKDRGIGKWCIPKGKRLEDLP